MKQKETSKILKEMRKEWLHILQMLVSTWSMIISYL